MTMKTTRISQILRETHYFTIKNNQNTDMKRISTILTLLMLMCMGAWADGTITVNIADGTSTNGPASYGDANSGTVNGNPAVAFKSTWTSNNNSGIVGLQLTTKKSNNEALNALAEETAYSSFHCLGFKPSEGNATDNLTITAPSGYIIISYYIEAGYWTSGEKYTLTASSGSGTTSYTTNAAPSNGTKGLDVSGINASSTTIFITSNQAANTRCLMINKFTVTIIPKEVFDAKASITNGKLYRIFTKHNGTSEGETKYYLTTSGTLTAEMASAGQFTFNATTSDGYVPSGYAWKISHNGYKFTNRPSNNPGQDHLNTTNGNDRDTYEAQVFYLKEGKYAVRSTNFNGSGSQYVQNSYWKVVEGPNAPNATYDDNEGNKHYVWQIEEIASVSFNLLFQGEKIRTIVKDRASILGTAELPDASWNNECCSYSFSPSTIDNETETVNVTMTWNIGELTFSSDYASATWYHMSLHEKWAKYDETVNGTNGHPLCANLNDVNYDIAGFTGMWAFVGNPLDGVYLINREAGDGQVLGWTTPPRMQSTSEGSSKRFIITKYGNPATGFILNYSGFYINDYSNGGQLKFWNDAGGATAAGSAITVEPISYYEKALMELDLYASNHAEGEYFGLKSSAVTTLRNIITDKKSTYNEGAYNTDHAAIESLWPGNNNENVNYPSTGYYRIKSLGTRDNGTPTYITCDDGTNLTTTTASNGINSVIKLTGSYPNYTISIAGGNVQAFSYNWSAQAQISNDPGNTAIFNVVNPGVVSIQNYPTYGLYFHEDGSHKVVAWETGDASYWKLVYAGGETITITLNSDGAETPTYYATTYLPFDVTITGADAYTLEKNGSNLEPTQLTGNKIPAGTPVLLVGTSNSATATINTDAAFTTDNPNSLSGSYVEQDFALTSGATAEYFLGVDNNNKVGFYHSGVTSKTENSTNYYTLAANRAYLSNGSSARGYAINWSDASSIQDMKTVEGMNSAVVYDLQGRRVENPQHGMYIRNGRVIVVK